MIGSSSEEITTLSCDLFVVDSVAVRFLFGPFFGPGGGVGRGDAVGGARVGAAGGGRVGVGRFGGGGRFRGDAVGGAAVGDGGGGGFGDGDRAGGDGDRAGREDDPAGGGRALVVLRSGRVSGSVPMLPKGGKEARAAVLDSWSVRRELSWSCCNVG